MHRNDRNRPLTPIGIAFVPLAFWLTHVVRPIFDTILPEKTKYKYRVADSSKDAENEPIVADKRGEKS